MLQTGEIRLVQIRLVVRILQQRHKHCIVHDNIAISLLVSYLLSGCPPFFFCGLGNLTLCII